MANDISRAVGYQQTWINPLFATYGSPLAQMMTTWLYGDRQSNPFADQPDQWPRAGRVAFIDRSLSFSCPSSTPVITTANLGGGKNILVFSRTASITTTTPFASPSGSTASAFVPIPSDLGNYVNVQIKRQDGFIDQESAAVNNNYGNGTKPFIRPAPEMWLGNQAREFTVTNNSGISLTVTLTFQIALLDTGR